MARKKKITKKVDEDVMPVEEERSDPFIPEDEEPIEDLAIMDTVEPEPEAEEPIHEMTPDEIVSESIQPEPEFITMQTVDKVKNKTEKIPNEKKNPKIFGPVISMSNLPGRGRKR